MLDRTKEKEQTMTENQHFYYAVGLLSATFPRWYEEYESGAEFPFGNFADHDDLLVTLDPENSYGFSEAFRDQWDFLAIELNGLAQARVDLDLGQAPIFENLATLRAYEPPARFHIENCEVVIHNHVREDYDTEDNFDA
jgi:hypothetical protein